MMTAAEAEQLEIGDRVMLKVTRGSKRGQTLTGTIDGFFEGNFRGITIKWDDDERAALYTRAEVEDEFELYAAKRQQ
jgi:hypothetical protein